MKVLYISAELNWCGATMSFMNLLRGMRKIGVECKVVAPDLGNTSQEIINFFLDESIDYVPLLYFWDITSINRKTPLKERIKDTIKSLFGRSGKNTRNRAKKALKDLIKLYKPDFVHTNVGVIHIGYEVCQELGVKHVWHLREYQDLDFNLDIYPTKDLFIERLKRTDAVITITKDIKSYFKLSLCDHAYTIYNGVADAKDIFLSDVKENSFVTACRLDPAKGISDIMTAFNLFYKNHKDYKLKILGTGDVAYVEELKSQASLLECGNAIEFVGFTHEVPLYMRKAKALLVGSFHEGFGRMTAEAAFNGCLVIGRNTSGTKEIMDAIGGFPFETIDEMVQQMHFVSQLSPKSYLEDAKTIQLKAVELYSNEAYCKNVYEVYRRCCN